MQNYADDLLKHRIEKALGKTISREEAAA